MSLTRTLGFRATHRYWKPEWSAEANRDHFGPATEEHPHRYTCAVTVSGRLNPETNMLVDLPELDRVLAQEITARFEGRALHREVPEFAGGQVQPTCEALARDLFARIGALLPAGLVLERIRVAEDETLSAECSREGPGEP